MIEEEYLNFLDDYICANNNEELIIKKSFKDINKFLTKVLKEICEMFPQIQLIKTFLNDENINTNYNYLSNYFVQINYVADENSIKYSTQKSAYRKLKEKFINDDNLIPTKEQIIEYIERNLNKSNLNFKCFKKNNILTIKIKDAKFFVFVDYNIEQNFVLFKRHYNFDIETLKNNLIRKNLETNNNFFKVVKFFKIVEAELQLKNSCYNSFLNRIFCYENIIYNVPNNLLCDEHIYKNYLNAVTFLENSNASNFVQADGEKLIKDNLYNLQASETFSELDFESFIKNNKLFIRNIYSFLKN